MSSDEIMIRSKQQQQQQQQFAKTRNERVRRSMETHSPYFNDSKNYNRLLKADGLRDRR
jgi:hypothetical protein